MLVICILDYTMILSVLFVLVEMMIYFLNILQLKDLRVNQ